MFQPYWASSVWPTDGCFSLTGPHQCGLLMDVLGLLAQWLLLCAGERSQHVHLCLCSFSYTCCCYLLWCDPLWCDLLWCIFHTSIEYFSCAYFKEFVTCFRCMSFSEVMWLGWKPWLDVYSITNCVVVLWGVWEGEDERWVRLWGVGGMVRGRWGIGGRVRGRWDGQGRWEDER